MEGTERVLAEKMKARLAGERDRQRRWRSRQKERGCKSVAGMISSVAYALLMEEKKRTGERLSDILERAIMGLCGKGKNNVLNNVISNEAPGVEPTVKNQPDQLAEIISKIENMRIDQRLPFNEIARRLNESGFQAPDGQGLWEGRLVYQLLKKLEIDDKPVDLG
ncbi:MAG: hypothetical protein ACOZF0_03245 [Thermodesulfobacteriota bacterium]